MRSSSTVIAVHESLHALCAHPLVFMVSDVRVADSKLIGPLPTIAKREHQ